jgi:uncharacterized membrane protein
MLGYDWIKLHAALNDLPVALLLASVVFDLAGAVARKESLKAAGYWCLIGGVVGGMLAAFSGLIAEGHLPPHSDASHAAMETHQTFAIVVVVFFGILALWRTARRGMLGKQEQTIFTTAGVIGCGLLIFTANLGGRLVFDRGMGLDGHVLQQAIEERRTGHTHGDDDHDEADHDHEHAVPAPPSAESLRALPDTTKHP